jgi:hypothetical protein
MRLRLFTVGDKLNKNVGNFARGKECDMSRSYINDWRKMKDTLFPE